MNPGRYITGWAEVAITGAEPEAALRALAEGNVPFWDAAPPRDYALRVRTPARALPRVRALAAKAGCEAEVLSLHGLPVLGRFLRRRTGLCALLLAALLLLAGALSRVWDIRVEGNDAVPTWAIRAALAECGVDIGAKWTGFSQDQIRNSMILRIPEIKWLTVTMEGCRARVIVRERIRGIEPVPENEYARVISDRAGLVTAVRALWGTAETEPGRMLLPGDTVIGGYTTGRFGVQGPARAIGYAEVRTWRDLTMAAPAAVEEKQPAGRSRTLWSLILGKKRINFYKDSSICPGDCDKIIERYDLALPGVFRLPIAVEKTVVTPVSLTACPGTELREEMEQALMEELLARIGPEGEVATSAFTASETEGVLYVTLRAECRERAGITEPLTAEEIRDIQRKIPQTEEIGP